MVLIDRFGHLKIWHGAGSILVAISFSSVFGGCFPCFVHVCGELHLFGFHKQGCNGKLSKCFYNSQISHWRIYTEFRHHFESNAHIRMLFTVPLDCILVNSCWMHLCWNLSCWNQGAKVSLRDTPFPLFETWAYLAFYVINDLQMAHSAKALVPAIIYISSFVVSVFMQEISWTGERLKAYYAAGGIIWLKSLMTVTGVSIQSVLVGSDLNGCAFVYGSLSFLDKISCGVAVYALQSFQSTLPRVEDGLSMEHFPVTRFGLGLVPAFCSLIGQKYILQHELDKFWHSREWSCEPSKDFSFFVRRRTLPLHTLAIAAAGSFRRALNLCNLVTISGPSVPLLQNHPHGWKDLANPNTML
ncbi:Major facilitator superfamily protein [Euphorbia peplus]|nr:Major facilitator superfamily protein [Euphorbia peplus]